MDVEVRRGLERAPERLRLQHQPGEDGSREETVGRQAAGAREEPEGGIGLHEVLVTTWAAGRFTTCTGAAAGGRRSAGPAEPPPPVQLPEPQPAPAWVQEVEPVALP